MLLIVPKLEVYLFSHGHVSDDAICEHEENEVLIAVSVSLSKLCHMSDDRGKVSWSVQLDSRHARLVRVQHT